MDLFNEADDIEVGTDSILRFHNEDEVMRFIYSACSKMHLTVSKILSSSQKSDEIVPRHLIIYIIKEHSLFTYKDIGKIFNRHHSTVMHSCEVISGIFEYHRKYPATTTKEYEYYHYWYEYLLQK